MKGESLRATPLRFVLVGVLVIAVGMAIWWTRSPGDELVYGSFSAPSYESVEALAAAADAIVEGVVDGVVGRELDYGTSNPDEQFEGSGVPLVFLEVTVLETLKGRTDNKIILGKIDAEILISPQSTPLRAGDQVLLFLVE